MEQRFSFFSCEQGGKVRRSSFSWEWDFCLQEGFYTLFCLFSSFPESSVDASSRKTRNYILISFSPYPSSRVGNAAFGSWKYSARKKQNESQSAPCCVPMNINPLYHSSWPVTDVRGENKTRAAVAVTDRLCTVFFPLKSCCASLFPNLIFQPDFTLLSPFAIPSVA